MRGEQLPQMVSGISPLGGALDGTPVRKRRAPAKATTKPPVGTTYACRCGYRTDVQRDYLTHLRAEIEDLRGELAGVRSGIPRKANGDRLIAECGTRAGYQRHGKLGEPPCQACRDEQSAHDRRRLADPVKAEKRRERARERRLDPEYRERRRVRDRKRRLDPEWRARANERDRKRRATPEYQERRRARQATPEYREHNRDWQREWRARKKAERTTSDVAATP